MGDTGAGFAASSLIELQLGLLHPQPEEQAAGRVSPGLLLPPFDRRHYGNGLDAWSKKHQSYKTIIMWPNSPPWGNSVAAGDSSSSS